MRSAERQNNGGCLQTQEVDQIEQEKCPGGVSYRGIDSDKPSFLGSKIDMPAKSIDSTGVQHPGNQINPGGSGRTRRPVCI
tara:strand:- start:116 stop:358 length:243 start_codon:yes stop_codon:yes gene_type:complete